MARYSEEQQEEFIASLRDTARGTLRQLQEVLGLPSFGDDEASLRSLDTFADMYSAQSGNTERITNGYIFGLGTLLGDLMIQKYGGKWVVDAAYTIVTRHSAGVYVELRPFAVVEARLKGDKSRSIFQYFYEGVPHALGQAVPGAAEHPVLQTIRKKSAHVIEIFGKRNKLADFGFNAHSVALLDRAVTQNIKPDSTDAFKQSLTIDFGAFLGECIVVCYGARWKISKEGEATLALNNGAKGFLLNPFDKMTKRIVNGEQDSLSIYFSELIPGALRS